MAIGGASDTSSVASVTARYRATWPEAARRQGSQRRQRLRRRRLRRRGGSASLRPVRGPSEPALAGLAGAGGSDGDGIGGGLYVATGAVVTLKKSTVAFNFASTSNSNIYGIVTYL